MTRCAALPCPIHIRIMEESEPNAFAVPGGGDLCDAWYSEKNAKRK